MCFELKVWAKNSAADPRPWPKASGQGPKDEGQPDKDDGRMMAEKVGRSVTKGRPAATPDMYAIYCILTDIYIDIYLCICMGYITVKEGCYIGEGLPAKSEEK